MDCCFKIKEQSEIYVGNVAQLLPRLLPKGRVVIISDANIDRRYHSLLGDRDVILIGLGESVKTLATVQDLCRRFIELGVDRSTFILSVGGGIVTDIAGFVASTYMRGLEFGFIPTTLLGQVDASIGGKNGVNVDGYKNMIGTFNQPKFVICDSSLLKTLPDREFRAGLAEIVKAGIIADPQMFERLESLSYNSLRQDVALLSEVINSSIRVKVDIVGRDELECGERRKLNLGHTLAHAIEKSSSKMNHGEAVAVGISLMSLVSMRLGLLSASDRERIVAMLTKFGFDLTPLIDMKRILKEVSKDKKSDGDSLHIVLPLNIGACEVRKIAIADFCALFE